MTVARTDLLLQVTHAIDTRFKASFERSSSSSLSARDLAERLRRGEEEAEEASISSPWWGGAAGARRRGE